MADPVNISTSLQNLKCQIQALTYYQQLTNDLTAQTWIATLESTLASNEGATPPAGYASVLGQSTFNS